MNALSRFQSYSPQFINVEGSRQASVALVLRNTSSVPQMFFIERAVNKSDPWSGQIAFPGGNRDPGDDTLLSTAIRETDEEVSIHLSEHNLVGRIDDQQGHSNYHPLPLVIGCFVFQLEENQRTFNNNEVADSFWVDLAHLTNAKNQIQYLTGYSPDPYPGVQLSSDRVLWGLTYRFVQIFLKAIHYS